MQFTKIIWRDGQPYSELYDDIYYSSDEGEDIAGENEFEHVFFRHNGLPQRWSQRDEFVIAELGFGSGLNCILTMREWLKHCDESKQRKTLHYVAIEKHPMSAGDIAKLTSRYAGLKLYADELIDNYPPAIEATHCRSLFGNRVMIYYKFMDVEEALDDAALAVDAWYLDGFSPAKNPRMWTQHLFSKIAFHSRAGATCSTYTAAGLVKRNLQMSGFQVEKVSGYGKKRDMLAAILADHVTSDKQTALGYKDKPWFQRPQKQLLSTKTATIIGAGIAGLSTAYALIGRGWKVTIIDRHDDICKETSSNPAPIVYPRLSVGNDVDTEYYTAAYCHVVYVLSSLQKKYRQRFWYGEGLLQSVDRVWLEKILNKFHFNNDYLATVDDSGGDRVTVEFKSAGVVRPGILCAVLKRESGNALDIVRADVSALARDGGKWQCLDDAGLIHEDEVLIVAGGAAINETGLPVKFPVEAIRGQVTVLNAKNSSGRIKKTLNAGVHITPMIDGKHYLGATYDRGNTSSATRRSDDISLLAALDGIYPGMFDEGDRSASWAGVRTTAQDRVPIIGAVPDIGFYSNEYSDICHGNQARSYRPARYYEGLYISAAHGSRGFTSSFISAEILASLIDGSPLPVNKRVLDYLNPSRFIVNDLKRR